MVGCDRSESGFDCLVCVEARLVHEVVEALTVEPPLDFREDCFDGVELRTVPDVPYGLHVQLRPLFFDARLLVGGRIVHEQRHSSLSHFSFELSEVVAEVFACVSIV